MPLTLEQAAGRCQRGIALPGGRMVKARYLRFRASSSSRVRGQSAPRRRERLRSARTLPPVWQVGAVVGFVVGVADALDGAAAARAGLAEAAVDGEFRAECGDVLGKFLSGFGLRRSIHSGERGARGSQKALPLFWLEFVGERDGRELSGVEDLVGVGVADAANEARIGESALEGAVFAGERGAECGEVGRAQRCRCRRGRCRGEPLRRAGRGARRGAWSRLR